jgi:GR25 family glycosyltransferase involved in LPS biosynthesis
MITIGYSTRQHNPELISYFRKSSGNPKNQVIEKINNGEFNLSQVYNQIIEESENDIVVLCHDDIYFDTNNWSTKLEKLFEKNPDYGIIGMAGTTHMPKSGMWWEDRTKMYGIVNHESGGKKWESKYSESFPNSPKEVVIVDGVFIAVNKKKLISNFDESVAGFHLYDVNFCFKNFLSGVKIGVTTNIRITHKSVGMTNDQWETNRIQFVKKYNDFLPTKIKYDKNSKLKILLSCLFFQKFTGSEMYVFEIAKNLVKLNHDVTVVASETNGPLVSMATKLGIKVKNLRETPGFKMGDGKWIVMTEQGPQTSVPNNFYQIDTPHFDIIHCQHKPIVEVMNMLYPTVDKICTIHSEVIDLENPIVHQSIKKYIAIRPEIKNYIVENFNIPDDLVDVIYNPIDETKFYPVENKTNNYILFVGSIDYLRKNTIYDLIEVSKNEKKELWLVGENKSDYLDEITKIEHVKYFTATQNVNKFIHNCCETAGILLGRTTIEGWLCGKNGWIYNINKFGNIIDKKLYNVPNNLSKFYSTNVTNLIYESYLEILNKEKKEKNKNTKLFDYFDKVVCINLKKRFDRKMKFISQTLSQDLGEFDFFEAIDGTTIDKSKYNNNLLSGEIGVILSNLEILKQSKTQDLKNILIIEDDCVFNQDMVENFDNLYSKVPDDWDMLYFGGNHNLHLTNGLPTNIINDSVIKIDNTFAIHCVAIKSHLFDEIIETVSKFENPIDVLYCQLQKKYKVYSFYPAIAKQDVDFSDIQNRNVNYNHLIS